MSGIVLKMKFHTPSLDREVEEDNQSKAILETNSIIDQPFLNIDWN